MYPKMASTNQSPQYQKAESMFLQAQTNEDKLHWLEEMIKECPKHKSAESMLANLKTRRKKLLEKMDKGKKTRRATKTGIKKEDMQAVIIGLTNTGKSSLLSLLTNSSPGIAPFPFTTKTPTIGMLNHTGTQIQIIEIPAIGSEHYDKGLTHTADVLLLLINKLEELKEIKPLLERSEGKKIVIFNNKFNLDKRKLEATLKSKKINYIIVNTKTKEGIEELKEKIFNSFDKMRIFTKEPGKTKSERPIVLNKGSSVKDVAEKILHGFSDKVKETLITGPSSKFPNQKVGLKHILRDMDVIEFKTR